MSPVDAALVRRKLARIAASLDALGPLAQLTLSEYRAPLYERKAAERLLHEGIEAALDVNAHLIAELGAEVPDDYYGGFVKLGNLGVLPRELALLAGAFRRSPEPPRARVRIPRRCQGAGVDRRAPRSVSVLRAGRRVLPDQGGRLARIVRMAVCRAGNARARHDPAARPTEGDARDQGDGSTSASPERDPRAISPLVARRARPLREGVAGSAEVPRGPGHRVHEPTRAGSRGTESPSCGSTAAPPSTPRGRQRSGGQRSNTRGRATATAWCSSPRSTS